VRSGLEGARAVTQIKTPKRKDSKHCFQRYLLIVTV